MSKIRVSLTLDKEIIDRIDRLAEVSGSKSRSEIIESILTNYMGGKKSAVILCGGDVNFGNSDIPRPLVKVNDETIIEKIVTVLRRYGYTNIFITGSKQTLEMISDLLGTGEGFGVNIAYFKENRPVGTAKVLKYIEQYIFSTFLVVPGDTLFEFDLNHMFDEHKKNNAIATVAVDLYPKPNKGQYKKGLVVVKGNKIIDYEDSPDPSKLPDNFVQNTGIMMFEPSIFSYIPDKDVSFLHEDVLPTLIKEGKAYAYPIHGYWFNIHDQDDLDYAKSLLSSEIA